MNHHVFVPVTDDIIYEHPEKIEGPLVPYSAGMECQNWLSIELNPDEADVATDDVAKLTLDEPKRPKLHLVLSSA